MYNKNREVFLKICEEHESLIFKRCFFPLVLISGIIILLSTFVINIFIKESPEIIFANFAAVIIFTILFVIYQLNFHQTAIAIFTFLLFILVLLPVLWLYDGGLKGPVPFFVPAVGTMIILLFISTTRKILIALLLIVITTLIIAEKIEPEIIKSCSTPACMEFNHAFGLATSLIFTLALMYIFALNHEKVREISINTTRELDQKNKILKQLANIDALTKLPNRRDIEEKIKYQHRVSKREKDKFSFIMCDIDDFKKINDNYGHIAGDFILKEIAKILKKGVREQDTPSRWGGEEFLILLPDCVKKEAAVIAERLRKMIEEHHFVYRGRIMNLTMSFGVAEYDFSSPFVKMFIEKADRAMYISKVKGKNRVTTL